MRKLWGGGSSSANSQPSSPSPHPDKPSPFASFIKSGKPSWPPGEFTPPSPTTAALFIKKDRKQSSVLSFTESANDGTGNQSPRPDFLASPPISPTQSTLTSPLRKPVQSSTPVTSPVAGPSSPAASPPITLPPRNPAPSDWNRTLDLPNVRDDLLISLLTSEAVVDSRECNILSGEEVEELKKEHQILNSRLAAAQKKLKLETKIRDAALSLSKLNITHDKLPKAPNDQLEVAERRVSVAQTDLWCISERAGEVERKLLEHRVGVLGYSVAKMDKKSMLKDMSGANTPNRIPTLSSIATSSVPLKARFDGAHLFAGHADAQIPKAPPAESDIASLEEKLRTAMEALSAANQNIAALKAELEDARKQREVEGVVMRDDNLAEVNALRDELDDAREDWEKEKVAMENNRLAELGILQHKLRDAREDWEAKKIVMEENKLAELGALQDELEDARAEWEAEKIVMEENKLAELGMLQDELEDARAEWETEKVVMEEKIDTLQNELEYAKASGEARAELEEVTERLRTMVQLHGIEVLSDSSSQALLSSIQSYLEKQSAALQDYSDRHMRLEDGLQAHLRKNEALLNDLDVVRQERDNVRLETLSLESRVKELADAASSTNHNPPIEYKGEVADVVSLLQPIWKILPAPELRATKLSNARHLRDTSATSTPGTSPTKTTLPSLSDTDIRALKSLYDPRSRPTTPAVEQSKPTFTVEAFVARVEALVVDDRALIDGLIHLAQAHDLLKRNAERAQKLVQDGNAALQTYQRQVTTLESQNMSVLSKQSVLMDEIRSLQDAVERAVTEKREMEMHAADQAEMCRQLTDVNDALSAKMLTLAEEAAAAPEKVRRQLEGQLAECGEALRKAKEEIEVMRTSEQTQRIALMDELNSMQMEHDNLRAQLRAAKR